MNLLTLIQIFLIAFVLMVLAILMLSCVVLGYALAYLSLARFERPELVGKLIQKIHERIAHVIQGQCADLALKDKLFHSQEN